MPGPKKGSRAAYEGARKAAETRKRNRAQEGYPRASDTRGSYAALRRAEREERAARVRRERYIEEYEQYAPQRGDSVETRKRKTAARAARRKAISQEQMRIGELTGRIALLKQQVRHGEQALTLAEGVKRTRQTAKKSGRTFETEAYARMFERETKVKAAKREQNRLRGQRKRRGAKE